MQLNYDKQKKKQLEDRLAVAAAKAKRTEMKVEHEGRIGRGALPAIDEREGGQVEPGSRPVDAPGDDEARDRVPS